MQLLGKTLIASLALAQPVAAISRGKVRELSEGGRSRATRHLRMGSSMSSSMSGSGPHAKNAKKHQAKKYKSNGKSKPEETEDEKKSRCSKRKEEKADAKEKTKAPKGLKKDKKPNRKAEKEAKSGLEIVGGQCVSDHTCAEIRGDPHLTTWDGMKFDCQGHGEFVLAKSMDSAFEVQGRFSKTARTDKSVSITKAISIDTGVAGAPTLDVYAEDVDGVCIINYYVNGQLAEDWGEDGLAYDGIEYMEDVDGGKDMLDYMYFTQSGVMYSVLVKKGSFGCVLNSKICLPPDMVEDETIFGLLGTPNGKDEDEWVSAFGTKIDYGEDTKWEGAYNYCTREHCVHSADESIFGYEPNTEWSDFYGCEDSFDPSVQDKVENPSEECVTCCSELPAGPDGFIDEDKMDACLMECMEGNQEDCTIELLNEEVLEDAEKKCPDSNAPGKSGPKGKAIVCRGSASDTNPYEKIEVSVSAVKNLLGEERNKDKKYPNALPGAEVEVEGKSFILDEMCKLNPEEPSEEEPEPASPDTPSVEEPEPASPDTPSVEEPEPASPDTPSVEEPEPASPDTPSVEEPEPEPTPDSPSVEERAPPAPDAPSPDDRTTDKAFTKGDPHFKTFGGELYDYHGECDLVLLHNPDFKNGMGMDIHIRTKIEEFWSSVESAAIKLGDQTMEIKADPESNEWLWFDGQEATSKLVDGEWNKHELAGFLVRYKQTGNNVREANVYLKGAKEFLIMKTFKSFVRVDVNWQGSDNYYNSVGLLGAHAHNGQRLGRDGKFIENVNAFGQEWQVRPEVDGSLFHSYEGAVVGKKCIMPPSYHGGDALDVSSLRGRRLGESALDTQAAEQACNHLVDPEEKKACVFDVIATQDLNMASTW